MLASEDGGGGGGGGGGTGSEGDGSDAFIIMISSGRRVLQPSGMQIMTDVTSGMSSYNNYVKSSKTGVSANNK